MRVVIPFSNRSDWENASEILRNTHEMTFSTFRMLVCNHWECVIVTLVHKIKRRSRVSFELPRTSGVGVHAANFFGRASRRAFRQVAFQQGVTS